MSNAQINIMEHSPRMKMSTLLRAPEIQETKDDIKEDKTTELGLISENSSGFMIGTKKVMKMKE